jgi:hypothetical protein
VALEDGQARPAFADSRLIFVDGGTVVHAEPGSREGEEAFFELMSRVEGTFEFVLVRRAKEIGSTAHHDSAAGGRAPQRRARV